MERNPHALHKTAVDSTLWWEFQPGQPVMTREGFPGVVTAVADGPYPGSESYRVRLDGGMGGGDYGPSELRPLAVGRAANVDHTAADDYPELGEILEQRPPVEHTRRVASLKQASFDPVDLDGLHQRYAGIMDWLSQPGNARDVALMGGGAYVLHRQHEVDRALSGDEEGPYGAFHQRSIDWCRFRKNQRCFFPKELDVEATRRAGHAVWTAVDRGYCPREHWDEQKSCPVSEPGPNSKDPHAQPAANMSGQVYTRGVNAAKQASLPVLADTEDLGFHMLASWADVQTKARRIRANGGVRILSSADGSIIGQVQGDQNVYQTALVRVPGKRSIATWECGCAWSAYSWGRSGRWRRYEGRMCSHALALQYEAQSRGMHGRPVAEDQATPHWLDPTIPVKVPGDWDMGKGRYSSLDTPDVAPGIVLAAELIADGRDPAQAVATLLPLGEHEARWLVREAIGFAQSFPAQYQGRHILFTFNEHGQPVINGQPVDPHRLLYPSFDPSAGLHIASVHEAIWPFKDKAEEQAAAIRARGDIPGPLDSPEVHRIFHGDIPGPLDDPQVHRRHYDDIGREAYSTGIPDHLTPGPLDKKLVDYKPDRKLSDPSKTVPITSILPQARETVYSKMPFIHHMHESGGMDPHGDTGAYMAARNKFFDSMPETDVPLDRLVVTQHNVNHERVKQMQEQPETRGNSLPQFVRHNGETWAINGHHRVVQEALDGAPTIRGRLWDLDGTVGHTALRTVVAGEDFAPIKDDHLGRCYEISAGRVAFGPDGDMWKGYDGAHLVHGTIQNYGLRPLEHAWVEEPDGQHVYEPATDHVYSKHDFERLHNPQVIARYSTQDARRKLSQTQHYGPWHGEYAYMTPEGINATHEAALPKTETCHYCSKQATDRVLHAEGIAYVPVCGNHQARAVRDVGGSNAVSGIKPIADLHDEPEPALPTTDGETTDGDEEGAASAPAYNAGESMEDSDDLDKSEGPDEKLARRQAGLGWLMQGGGSQARGDGPASRGVGGGTGSSISNGDIAAAARAHLAKTGTKKFSPSEQAKIINEGAGVRAANFDDLRLEGTHYQPLDDLHALDEETLWP